MQPTPTISLVEYLNPWRLVGPLADKELRVASRRIWSHVLPGGYLVLLCLLMVAAWYSSGSLPRGTTALGVSWAATVSGLAAYAIISFQSVAAQLVAALILSSSIGDELRRGTLSVLLTTPIASIHIVAGKLLSGLLQIVLLLSVSLPVLAVLRVLGGLSWDQVFAAFWITLTAAVFAASLSLVLSTYYGHPFQAISAAAVVYLVLFAGIPFAVACLLDASGWNPLWIQSVLDLTNPFRALGWVLPRTWQMQAAKSTYFFSWPVHCLIMAALTAVALCVSVRRVRRAAAGGVLARKRKARTIRRVHGSAVAWKENPGDRLLGKRTFLIAAVVAAVCVFLARSGVARNPLLGGSPYYILAGLWLVAFLRLAMSAAGGITREKESGAWQVLLTTPLEDRQILWGKVVAALRRNAVLLVSLLAIQTCQTLSGSYPGPGSVAGVYAVSRLAAVGFILGAGLYFGTRLRTTTTAVAATVVAFLCANYVIGWISIPLLIWLWNTVFGEIIRRSGSYALLLSVVVGTGGAFLVDVVFALYLLRRARQNVRRYVF